jgi:hypothetical protein
MGFDWLTSMMPYGDIWRTSRRLLHAHLHQGAASKYHFTQIMAARKLAQEILIAQQDVGMLSHVVRANFGRMIIEMVYGIVSEESASEQLSLAEEAIEASNPAFVPGHFLVDLMTFCECCCFLCF